MNCDDAAVFARLDEYCPGARHRRLAFAYVHLAAGGPCQIERTLHLRHAHCRHRGHDAA